MLQEKPVEVEKPVDYDQNELKFSQRNDPDLQLKRAKEITADPMMVNMPYVMDYCIFKTNSTSTKWHGHRGPFASHV